MTSAATDLPEIAPVRTSSPPPAAAAATAAKPEVDGCVTPRSEEHQLKPPKKCPPAPRKPRPSCRKRPPSGGLLAVPRDLTLVFVALASGPPEKKMRFSA